MAANMYRVGDYVFFETSSTTPYQIRRIEELNKTPNGNVEAKVMCFYRRRDISSSLIMLADKHQSGIDGDSEDGNGSENGDATEKVSSKPIPLPGSKEELEEKEKHQLKHRELFLSRQVETLPATHIRGKCAVTLLNETESLLSYLNKDDAFFYSLVYDPQQKTLLADKGEIRVGSRFQAEATPLLKEGETDGRDLSQLEQLVWITDRSITTDKQIDQFLVIARSVGTFARALDCTSTVRQPSLHMSAAAASRDITLFHAMDTLHKHKYDVNKAIASLVPSSGPVLCRDEIEEWSASEANLFEEALDKYGKDFNDIRQDFLPWKSLKSIVEYYYMWKTTDRYVQQKRIKAAEAESKLKQVYIPNYNKPNPAQISDLTGLDSRGCESCYTTQSPQWYSWGPVHMQCRLCAMCWVYWKKYGGLKMPTRLDGARPNPESRQDVFGVTERLAQMAALQRMHRCTIGGCGKEFRLKAHLARHLATAHGLAIRSGSPRPVMKTRAAFCLITTTLTRTSRQVCSEILLIQRSARQPFQPINIALIKQECSNRLAEKKPIKKLVKRKRRSMNDCSAKMGIDISIKMPLLEHTAVIKEPEVYAFPKGPVPPFLRASENATPTESSSSGSATPSQPSILGKRGFDQSAGSEPAPKRQNIGVIRQAGNAKQMEEGKHPRKVSASMRGSVINQSNGGRSGRAPVQRTITAATPGAKKLSWMETLDDMFFSATENTRKLRKALSATDFKKAARKPWRVLKGVKTLGSGSSDGVVVLD